MAKYNHILPFMCPYVRNVYSKSISIKETYSFLIKVKIKEKNRY
jgi:hypothetical protein